MFAEVVLRPAAHGAVGPLDEIITLLPLVIGAALLLYLYFSRREAKRHPTDAPLGRDDDSDEL
jgi:hypothetical protein